MTSITDWILYFILMLMRISALFVSSPIFGRKNVPNTAKIVLAVAITYILIPVYPPHAIIGTDTLLGFAGICIKELTLGLIIGYMITLFFSTVQIAGQMVDFQLGLSMAQAYDANSGQQIPITANLLTAFLIIMFFITDSHLVAIQMLCKTFESAPVGEIQYNREFIPIVIKSFVNVFEMGVRIAMPIIAAGLMVEVLFGILMKVIPQVNFFVIGVPIKLIIGFAMLFVITPLIGDLLVRIFEQMFASIDMIFMKIGAS